MKYLKNLYSLMLRKMNTEIQFKKQQSGNLLSNRTSQTQVQSKRPPKSITKVLKKINKKLNMTGDSPQQLVYPFQEKLPHLLQLNLQTKLKHHLPMKLMKSPQYKKSTMKRNLSTLKTWMTTNTSQFHKLSTEKRNKKELTRRITKRTSKTISLKRRVYQLWPVKGAKTKKRVKLSGKNSTLTLKRRVKKKPL